MRRKRMIAFVLLLVMILVNIPFQGVEAQMGQKPDITVGNDDGWKPIDDLKTSTYAVLEGTLTLPDPFIGADATEEDKYPAISIAVTDGNLETFKDTFQVIYSKYKGKQVPTGFSIKVPGNANYSYDETVYYDGVYIFQEIFAEKINGGIPTTQIYVRVVRLNNWAYFFMNTAGGSTYELVHRMYIETNTTRFEVRVSDFDTNEKLTMSNISVDYGKDAAVNALNGNTLCLQQPNYPDDTLKWDAVYFPVDSKEWTLQARVSLTNYDEYDTTWEGKENRTVYASPWGFNEGMAIHRQKDKAWKIQNLGAEAGWKGTDIADSYSQSLYTDGSGGMWIRWMKSGSFLSVYLSADGKNWTFVGSRSLITEDFELQNHTGIYIDTQRAARLTDISISLNTCVTQSMGETTQISSYPNETYAVLSGTLKVKGYDTNVLTLRKYSNVAIQVVYNTEQPYKDAFQILYCESAKEVKLIYDTNYGSIDNVSISREQWKDKNDGLLDKMVSDAGLNIKVVRMNTWAYLLAENKGGCYELIGRMAGLNENQGTQFALHNEEWGNDSKVILMNAEVTTGKKATLDAMNKCQFSIFGQTDFSRIYFPVDSNDWTLEAKVSVKEYDSITTSNTRSATVGPSPGGDINPSEWTYGMSICYLDNQWKIQETGDYAGHTEQEITSTHASKLNPSEGGMWIRWVRYYDKLTVYTRADNEDWVQVLRREDLKNSNASDLGMYINADKETTFTDVRITLDKGTPHLANITLEEDISVNFWLELDPEVIYDDSAYVEFELPGENHTENKVFVKDVLNTRKSQKISEDVYKFCYKFSCGIAAKEMASQIKYRIVSGHNNREGTQYAYRARKYGEYVLSHVDGVTYKDADAEMVKAMLNYGAYAQQHFAYNTGRLANAGMSEADKTLQEIGNALDSYTREKTVDENFSGLTYAGTSLMTTYQTKIRHYFLLDEGENSANFTFQYDNDSNNAKATRSGKYYYVECPGILASKLGDRVTLTVTNTTNSSKMTIKYSPYTNVKAITEDKNNKYTDASKNMMRALYWYGKKAKEYTTP